MNSVIEQAVDKTTLSIDARSSSADEAQGELAWSRSLVLPELAEGEKAKCSVKHGVLTIRVPKARARSAQMIPVRAG
jgi:HSP20 family molecular chaperone IbpA